MAKRVVHDTELVKLSQLTPHPRNYREHLDDQVEHLMRSISDFGFYRNVVIASDDVILAGHGVVQAAQKLGKRKLPVVRMPFDSNDPRALKLLAADNTLSFTAMDDDRALTELLRELAEMGELPGTGFDSQQLAALAMVTRPASELADFDAASEWLGAGMPEFAPADDRSIRLVISFDSETEREELAEQLELTVHKPGGATAAWAASWPPRPKEDLASLRFEPEAS